jgi:hypothetical protein
VILVNKVYSYFTFGYYIQYVAEAYLMICFVSFSEIYYIRRGINEHEEFSYFWFVSALFLVFCIIFAGIQWGRYFSDSAVEKSTCKMWFNGIREWSVARIQTWLYFFRRFALCFLVLIFAEQSLLEKTVFYIAIQVTYMAVHFSIRPYKTVKDQILEWFNEISYLVLIVILLFWKEKDDWSKEKANIYIWIMISNNAVFLILSISNTFI